MTTTETQAPTIDRALRDFIDDIFLERWYEPVAAMLVEAAAALTEHLEQRVDLDDDERYDLVTNALVELAGYVADTAVDLATDGAYDS